MHIDRKKTPPSRIPGKIGFEKPEKVILSNDIPLYLINSGTQDILRIEWIFNSGTWYETRSLVASTTNAMLNEGTSTRSSEEISEGFDFYGSYFHLQADNDTGSIILYTLKKYLKHTLEIVADIIHNSILPEKEFTTYIRKKRQQFIEDQGKVKTVARKTFLKTIFGENHAYGKETVVDDFEQLDLLSLVDFYKNRYRNQMVCILVSGKTWSGIDTLFDNLFGKVAVTRATVFESELADLPKSRNNQKIVITKQNVFQSAIRIGKPMFNKLHPDFTGMQILNTVLGGYFGSRLMKNIREDKGYTYGIGSILLSLHHAGYFVIASEVGSEVTGSAIEEIHKEMEVLRDQLIPEEELSLVKNYIIGQIIRMFDGPFSTAETFKSLIEYNMGYDYYDRILYTVKTITANQLRDLANKYLIKDSFAEVIAGKY